MICYNTCMNDITDYTKFFDDIRVKSDDIRVKSDDYGYSIFGIFVYVLVGCLCIVGLLLALVIL